MPFDHVYPTANNFGARPTAHPLSLDTPLAIGSWVSFRSATYLFKHMASFIESNIVRLDPTRGDFKGKLLCPSVSCVCQSFDEDVLQRWPRIWVVPLLPCVFQCGGDASQVQHDLLQLNVLQSETHGWLPSECLHAECGQLCWPTSLKIIMALLSEVTWLFNWSLPFQLTR